MAKPKNPPKPKPAPEKIEFDIPKAPAKEKSAPENPDAGSDFEQHPKFSKFQKGAK